MDGYSTDGAAVSSTIKASVQPISAHDLMTLEEGRRNSRGFTIITETKLNLSVAPNQNPDIIVIDGDDYEVVAIQPWKNGVINHFRVMVMAVIES